MSKQLLDLSKSIRFDNASKGFDPTEGGVERYLLLVISEICEAQEELRDGRLPTEIYYEIQDTYELNSENLPIRQKPCGFPVEIADAIIRILDIQAKLEFNIHTSITGYQFDAGVSLDKELLAVTNAISRAYVRGYPRINFEGDMNLALSALFNICENLNIPIMQVITEKLAFNRSRPPKHGRKF